MQPFTPELLPVRLDWERLIPYIGQANRAIAQYDGVLFGLPNPAVLLSPLTTQEAVLSSRIEGTQATLGEVLKFEAGEKPEQESKRLDIQEIINYRIALGRAEQELRTRPFNLNLLLDLHSTLLDSVRGRNKSPGQFRRVQNWIGAPGTPMEEAQFVPPAPPLDSYLDNWEKYYHAERPDPLVQLAVIHAQFEILHPFLDGNGRLGRLLIPVYLYEKHILSRPMFYLSSYLDRNRDEYIRRLRAIGKEEQAWNLWVSFFLTAIIEQARENAEKARTVLALYERLKREVIGATHSQYAIPLLDSIFQRPIFQVSHLRGDHLPSRATMAILINQLKEKRILTPLSESRGRRSQVLALAELVNLCEGRKVV